MKASVIIFQVYKIQNPLNLGHAVIINNVASEYPGSKKDVEKLKEVYNMMNFQVHVYEDIDDSVRTTFVMSWFDMWYKRSKTQDSVQNIGPMSYIMPIDIYSHTLKGVLCGHPTTVDTFCPACLFSLLWRPRYCGHFMPGP